MYTDAEQIYSQAENVSALDTCYILCKMESQNYWQLQTLSHAITSDVPYSIWT